jgi:Ala-tRNA(Pro) deacylase
MSEESNYDRLLELLEGSDSKYELLSHEPEGRTDLVSAIRGNRLSEAAKAMVLMAKGRDGSRDYYLAIVGGDSRVDFGAIKEATRAAHVMMAPPEKAAELTGCVMGAVPPFSFNTQLKVIADARLLSNERIVFNAARLDRSIFMSTSDYISLAKPVVTSIAKM